jgi:ribosome-associated protein
MHPRYDNLLADFGRCRQRLIPASELGPREGLVGRRDRQGQRVPDNRAVPDVVSDLVVSPRVTIPAGELRWRFSRSSGPGGQGVNTTDSRVELSFDVATSPSIPPFLRERAISRLGERLTDGVLVVAASEHRSQLRNREAAAARLVSLLRGALAPPPRTRRPTMPSRGAIERRLTDKKANAKRKADRRTPPDW